MPVYEFACRDCQKTFEILGARWAKAWSSDRDMPT